MNWKKELLNAKEEFIWIKYERGEGATYAVVEKILNTDKDINVLYIGNYRTLEDKLMELKEKDVSIIAKLETNYRDRKAFVKTIFGNEIRIICTTNNTFKGGNFDIGISDGLHIDIPEAIKECKQKIIILPEEEYRTKRLINSDKVLGKLPLNERIENYKKELFTELENIPMNDKTTMTRERIIGMIKSLDHIGR